MLSVAASMPMPQASTGLERTPQTGERFLAGVAFAAQLLGDRLDLGCDLVYPQGISPFDAGERGSLAPAAIEELRSGRDPVTVSRLGIQGDLQEDLGKDEGRTPAHLAHRLRNPSWSPSGVAALARLPGAKVPHCSVTVLSGPHDTIIQKTWMRLRQPASERTLGHPADLSLAGGIDHAESVPLWIGKDDVVRIRRSFVPVNLGRA